MIKLLWLRMAAGRDPLRETVTPPAMSMAPNVNTAMSVPPGCGWSTPAPVTPVMVRVSVLTVTVPVGVHDAAMAV
jgi:hypothetical protein